MPIITVMRSLVLFTLLITAARLFAAPLEGGFSMAPKASASSEEKARAYLIARERVIESARKYEGVPYQYGGMSRNGMDCSGFISLSFKDAIGVSLPRSASGIYTWAERINIDKAQPGDFLFFKTGPNNSVTHVGLYLGSRRFIHAASSGQKTGVIYSNLDEQYWIRTYAGAGRAFPENPPDFILSNNTSIASSEINKQEKSLKTGKLEISVDNGKGWLLMGVALAPIWNSFIQNGELIRGVSSQLYIFADTNSFGSRMVWGLELRPEYDAAFGIFSLPMTLSWGPSEKLRVFAGTVLTIGEAELSTEYGARQYSSRSNMLATIGATAAPFAISSAAGDFSPYFELAWQSYFSDNQNFDLAADLSASFRFTSGIRWLIQVK